MDENSNHPLGFDPKLVEDSGEWKLKAEPAKAYTAEPEEQTPVARKPNGNLLKNISFLFMVSVAGGSVGTWGIHALNCDGGVEKSVVGTAEAATQPNTITSPPPGPAPRSPASSLPDIHEPLVPTPYTPRHVLTPLEQRFYSKLSPQNPAKDPVLYCRQEGGKVVLYNDIVDVVQQPAGATDCAHLYRTLTGKYFYVNGRLAEEADDTVNGFLGKQAARELDYRIERNGRFVKQEKPHGIKVGDTIHFAPYQDRHEQRKERRGYSRR